MSKESKGALKEGEAHPAAYVAKRWLLENVEMYKLPMYLEAFSLCAIEGNRLGEICSETLCRLMNGQPTSDRYLLGLIWSIRKLEEDVFNDE